MIAMCLEMLKLIKKNKVKSRYIGIALGDNKYPQTYKEAYKLFKRKLWQNKEQ